MSGLRLTALAAVVAAFLIAPAALLAEQPSSDSSVSSGDGGLEYGAATGTDAAGADTAVSHSVNAEPSTTAEPSAGESADASASLRTSSSSAETTKEPIATSSGEVQVTIGDFFFRPQDININVGDSVTWTNDGKVPEGHTVTGDGFDSGVIKSGETYSRIFNSVGAFDYVCTLHPNMRGTVTVTVSGGAAAGGGGKSSGGSSGTGAVPSTTPGTSTASGDAGSSGGSLAHTGLNLILLAEIAGCFIATGLLIQRLIYGSS